MALVAESPTATSFAEVAADLKASQAHELEAVNEVILDHLSSSVPLIPEVASYLIKAGGKRLRPLMTLASGQLCGAPAEKPRLLAAAVELIHAATLLHDDVVDDSALRRGLKTANIIFGNKESVLVGDFLFARAFQLMVKTGSLRVLDVLSAASCTISEGEVLQLETQAKTATTKDQYIQVVSAKTAALFAAATQSGAIVGDAPEPVEDAFYQYGLNFGIAYQLVDDALDYDSATVAIGKTAGDDFREGKMTLPVILAIADARGTEERAFWERTLGEGVQAEGDFERACDLMARDRVIPRALDAAAAYAEDAASALSVVSPAPLRSQLEDLARRSVVRRS